MMTLAEIRLKQNPILTSILLGMGQGSFAAQELFPRLPQTLSAVIIPKLGNQALQRYNLRRAPGAATKRVDIQYEGVTYTVKQYAVEVPMPREYLREADEERKLNVRAYMDVSKLAMNTADQILALDYELDAAGVATTAANYPAGHVVALAAGTKWSASTGTPVTDVRAAANVIRKKIGKRPNKLILSPDAELAASSNPEVKGYLPSTQMGAATLEQLATIFKVKKVVVAEAVWVNGVGDGSDVWGNNAVLAYVPELDSAGELNMSLADPAFGYTNVIEGHPFSETPYFERTTKSWIYGATYERQANVTTPAAAFLFQNTK